MDMDNINYDYIWYYIHVTQPIHHAQVLLY